MARKYIHFRNAHLAWEELGWNPTSVNFEWQDTPKHREKRSAARLSAPDRADTKHDMEK